MSDEIHGKIPLYNPLDHDFEDTLLNDANEEVRYTLPSHDISYFEPPIAHVIEKHLITAVTNERNLDFRDGEEIIKIEKEVKVDFNE